MPEELRNRVAVIGVGCTPFGELYDRSAEDLIYEAAFEAMTDADWRRAGVHTESGPYTATKWLQIYAEHAEIHAAQIRQNRAAWAARRGGRP